MEKATIDDLDSYMGPADVKRPVGDAVGAEHLALNYYELAPGESFAFGYHAHDDQEEVFYVQQGTVTFETDDGPVDVGPGEVVRFAPGEFQRGVNDADGAGDGDAGDGGAGDGDAGDAGDGDAGDGDADGAGDGDAGDGDADGAGDGDAGDGDAGDGGDADGSDGDRVVALALGAPRDGGDFEIRRECADCGDRTPQSIEATDDRDALVTLCEDCGAETGRFT